MERTIKDVYESLNESQKDMLYYLVGYAFENGRNYIVGSGDFDNYKQRELRRKFNTLNEEQKYVVEKIIEEAINTFRDSKKKKKEV